MGYVDVINLVKRFDTVTAVDGISFDVKKGEFITLLGPSGSGKTTALRCIAGLEKHQKGEITIDGQLVSSAERGIFVPPEKREIGMVFQSYAIWPHMNVFENVAYPLKARKYPKHVIQEEVHRVLEVVGLKGLEDRAATKLSGGQQQRVALARALIYKPKLLLFDEPLSNLDAKLRERMRVELKNLQRSLGITSIYVTHDQAEAMILSDRIIVMDKGRILQIGDPKTIYLKPANEFVADFIGTANFLEGRVLTEASNDEVALLEVTNGVDLFTWRASLPNDVKEGDKVLVSIRPQHFRITRKRPSEGSNVLSGKIAQTLFYGAYYEYRIKSGERTIIVHSTRDYPLAHEEEVYVEVEPSNCTVIPLRSLS